MNGLIAFQKITHLSDDLLADAAFDAPVVPTQRPRRPSRLLSFLNSGLGVALICGIVAFCTLGAIVWAGTRWDPTAPPSHSTQGSETLLPETTPPVETSSESEIAEPDFEGLAYTSHGDGTCHVSAFGRSMPRELVIPSVSPDGDTVIGIGDYALSECESIYSVTIPDTVTYLGERAFYHCDNLQEVYLPASVQKLGEGVFCSCYALRSVNIPEGITFIPDNAFFMCMNLETVTLPSSVRRINIGAFNHCYSLRELTLSEGLVYIDDATFMDCYSLNELRIPEGVKEIGFQAFAGCYFLSELSLPRSLESLEALSFANLSLTEIDFSGTKAEWRQIEKADDWHEGTDTLTVHCIDGDLP